MTDAQDATNTARRYEVKHRSESGATTRRKFLVADEVVVSAGLVRFRFDGVDDRAFDADRIVEYRQKGVASESDLEKRGLSGGSE